MEYNNYFDPASQQSFPYIPYAAGGAFNGIHSESAQHATGIDSPINTQLFSTPFDYQQFDPGTGHHASLTQLPQNSASPPAQSLPLNAVGSVDGGYSQDEDQMQRRRSSSEEKESLTPAQTRRKAQNRAAQRAFRERKERHVRDLEAKLNLLTTTTSSLQSDNERLKLQLQRMQTENEILRARELSKKSLSSSPSHQQPSFVDDPMLLTSTVSQTGALGQKPPLVSRFSTRSGTTASPGHFSSSPDSDSHLLSASATWDLLQSHPLYLTGAVDIGEVCERLKKLARCENMGPMFEEDDVRRVIEDVGRTGGDELI